MKSFNRLFLLVLFIQVLPFLLLAQDKETIPRDPAVRSGILSNGMKYYIRHNEKPENRAELRLAVRAGSIQEDEDQLGLAHFVEHMAFNGSEHFAKNELVDYLESIGTRFGPDLNAYTSFDETVYMLQARTDSMALLEKGLLVLEDWAHGLSFDEEEIDKERGVVVSEWRSGLSPDQRMFQQYMPIQYKDSRYAQRLPIGDPKIIETADYETVKRFYEDWYRPNLMAVIAVGDFDVDWMEQEIKKRFGDLQNPEQTRERKDYTVPPHKETLVAIVSDPEASFTRVQVVYKHPHISVENQTDFRQSIARTLYNRMLNARLEELTQQADPPYTFAYSGYSRDLGDIDAYEAYAMVAEGGVLKGMKTVLEENQRVLQHGFLASELERAKTELLKSAERAVKEQEKTESRSFASQLVYHYLNKTPVPSSEQAYGLHEQYLPTIKVEEVNALAKKWIRDENRVVVITGPKKEAVPMPEEAEVRAVLEDVANKKMEPYTDDVSDAPLLEKELTASKFTEEKVLEDLEITKLTLANGIEIYLKPTDFKNDEIIMQATSPGGYSLYSIEDFMSASAATSIVREAGLGEFSSTQLDKKLTGKRVSVSPYIGELYEGFSGSASPEDLETMFQLVYLYFTAPRMDETAVQSYVAKQKSIFQNLMSNPQYYFYDQTTRIKYGDDPRRTWPSAEDLEAINLKTAMKVYQERFADASDFTFFFVGNFDVEGVKPLLAKYLGNLPVTGRKETWKDLDIDIEDGVINKTFARGEAPKTLVEITYHGNFNWTVENMYKFYSMLDVLRIKMRESMREDKGGVYGVSVSGSTSTEPEEKYSITISFNSEPDKAQELISTAMQDINTAQEKGAEEKDLQKVKETQRQNRIKNLKENRFWLQIMESIDKGRYGKEYILLEGYEKYVNSLSPDDIQEAANHYFDAKNRIEIVMTPEEEKEN